MQNRVYSEQFDDIYFSPENGLAESDFVFFEGNDLPARWAAAGEKFTIAETGFGTGLNFLLACKKFKESVKHKNTELHYISFEKYPLSRDDIAEALECWRAELSSYLDAFLKMYPLRVPGFHRVQLDDNIFLTLIFDDANDALPQLDVPQGVDAWFLDGFAPSKNPDMWSDEIFAQMARLSAPTATFATFTAAGFVKRGLQEAGFDVHKVAGFGRKRGPRLRHPRRRHEAGIVRPGLRELADQSGRARRRPIPQRDCLPQQHEAQRDQARMRGNRAGHP